MMTYDQWKTTEPEEVEIEPHIAVAQLKAALASAEARARTAEERYGRLNAAHAEQHERRLAQEETIDGLHAENERLEQALRPFAMIALARDYDKRNPDRIDAEVFSITPADVLRARKALSPTGQAAPAERQPLRPEREEPVLPCDVTMGSCTFRKGVKMSVLQGKLTRMYEKYAGLARQSVTPIPPIESEDGSEAEER